ncbi:MAG: acetyl-CoA acetyltransferase [Dehalococcoidia bacterium]|nr:acetyl-CoA acetyltransferase [Dehalococcoidia bacterium]
MRSTLRDKVAIVGAGCTPHRQWWDKSGDDLLIEACWEAFEDAGIGPKDIQAGWLGGGITGQTLAHALQLDFIPVTKVDNWCATGGDVIRNAAMAVAGGFYDIVLATGFSKSDKLALRGNIYEGGSSGTWLHGQNVTFAGPAGGTFATFVPRYMHHYGVSYEDAKRGLGAIAVKNYANGALNPKAFLRKAVTMEEYLNAPMLTWPLSLHDTCSMPDGAAALILTTPEIAQKLRPDYVLLKGLGMSVGTKQGQLDTKYDWVHFPEAVLAGRQAYEMAGIRNPLKELDLACVHDAFTVVELVIYEDLGWAPRGQGYKYVQEGVFDRVEGELAVNPNGGLKSFGHGGGGSGLHKAYEVYKQLQGKAGERQVKNASLGLAHDQGGYPGTYTVVIDIWGTRD